MNRIHLFIILLLFTYAQLIAQQKLSTKATVSVVTCGSGDELFSTFGHSAFRVFDPLLNLDKIYNYGTFDFNAPNFYLNFARGKLIYHLSTSTFSRFFRVYQYENRWMKTQELNLSTIQVQAVFNFLENNAKPENKSYQYDFFYDNCSTKIEDVIKTVLNDNVTFNNNHITSTKTHRDLIADYTRDHKWSKFGIDLALGSVIDKKTTKDNYKFLPDYIYQAFDNATITIQNEQQNLVKKNYTILKEKNQHQSYSILQPLNIFIVIALFIVFRTYKDHKLKRRTKWIDTVLYFSTGLTGVVVLLLWFATSHTATYENLNFLWAFAPNLIVTFYLFKSKLPKWVLYYNWFLLILLVVMCLLWVLKIQVFNTALIPLVLALFVRYSYLARTNMLFRT